MLQLLVILFRSFPFNTVDIMHNHALSPEFALLLEVRWLKESEEGAPQGRTEVGLRRSTRGGATTLYYKLFPFGRRRPFLPILLESCFSLYFDGGGFPKRLISQFNSIQLIGVPKGRLRGRIAPLLRLPLSVLCVFWYPAVSDVCAPAATLKYKRQTSKRL